jgi:AraC-like DNA-binding protein
MVHQEAGVSAGRMRQDPELLRRLLRAKDRMDAASHEEWPVRRLAWVSGASEAHFARSFKEAFGVPPHRYLLTRRIERATALLRDTDLSITQIAFETGWNSLGTFARTFKDVTGESPSELRARAATAQTLREVVAKGAMPPLVLMVDDCRAVYDRMRARGVEFTQEPMDRYGTVDAGFRDPSGNGWKMIEAHSLS